ncbi:4-hydroxy-tetrahydrodipicolinate synthase [Actinopolymorpha cephalotaxi]|nr:dihydrodipicolinate synthase family protein [Actinopolymorpha cephalotaxi]SFH42520.1 4-hydroxy-tetrahydrodipicolinate synthase [Actinopolymorpha cephalotaxi]
MPAVLTMFDADGALDEVATAEHIERLVSEGVHGVVVGGTSGEFIGLSPAERDRLVQVAVRTVRGRVPVVAGTGAYATQETIELTRAAAGRGADGAIVILPYFQKPTRDEVMRHLRSVGAASPIPVMAYNNPANSGAPELRAADLAALFGDGAITAVKSTFPSVHQVHEARAAVPDEAFRILYGSFTAPLEALAGGADGWISGILNVVAADALALFDAIGRADLAAARQAWARILPIRRLYTEQLLGPVGDLAIYRGILRLRGLPGGHCRAPLLDLTPSQEERLAEILDASDKPEKLAATAAPGRHT